MHHLKKSRLVIYRLYILLSFIISGYFVNAQTPVISSFLPAAAIQGTVVEIKGSNLSGITEVSFGGVPAEFFYMNTDTSILATVASGASGYVRVVTPTGTDSLSGFTFLPGPSISSITPTSGITGDLITIYGANLQNITAVSFGGIPATSFTELTDTSLTAVVGNGSTGSIIVTGLNGQATGAYFNYLGPEINSFSPGSGGMGTVVTINGTNLSGVTSVKFGGTEASSFNIISDNRIDAIMGLGSTGEITVSSAAGSGAMGTFYATPVISSFAPLAGSVGSSVIINGHNFSPVIAANTVFVGGIKAIVTAASTTSLTITIPSGITHKPISVITNGLTGNSIQSFTTTFTAGPLLPGYFAMRQLISYTHSPNRVTMGDLNGDGKPELVTSSASGLLSVYNNNCVPGTINFADPIDLNPGSNGNVTGVVIDEFSGDDNPDIAIINYGYNIVSIFRNAGIPGLLSFTHSINLPTGSNPSSIAAADVNNDGKMDILVTNNNNNTVSVFRNTGTNSMISFAPRINFPTGLNPSAIATADFNKDGKIDMAISNESASTVTVYKNTGSGITPDFTLWGNLTTGPYPRRIATTDFNDDGYLDLVVTSLTPDAVSVFRNTSNGVDLGFDLKIDYPTSSGSNHVAVNDMDGDGKKDIIAPNFGTASFDIFKNTGLSGSISFAEKVAFPLKQYANQLITGDVDGDGKPDVIAIDDGLVVLRNKVNHPPVISSFSPLVAYPGDTIDISGNNFTGVTSVSFGGIPSNSFILVSDKLIRAIPGAGSGTDITVTTPYGIATVQGFNYFFSPVITGISPQSGPVGSTVIITGNYFNADPALNLVKFGTINAEVTAASATSLTVIVPPAAGNQRITVTTNGRIAGSTLPFAISFAGAGNAFNQTYFDTTISISLGTVFNNFRFTTGDLEGDNKPDLIISGSNGGANNETATYKNISSNNVIAFGPKIIHPQTKNVTGQPLTLDVNGDGKPEVILQVGTDLYSTYIFKNESNNGTISLTADLLINYSAPGEFTVHAGDFDGDGRTDIIIKSYYSTQISVFRNISNNNIIAFAAPIHIGHAPGSYSSGNAVMVEDFNGDGRPDIGLVNDDQMSVFKNTGALGNIQFAARQDFSSLVSSRRALSADIDGDGKPDIVKLGTSSPYIVSVVRNNSSGGNISFEPDISLAMNYNMYQLYIDDLDGDTKPDICVNSINSNLISIFKNTSIPGVVAFVPKIDYRGNGPGKLSIADLDADGKADIITSNNTSNIIKLLRNTIGEPLRLVLCPPSGNIAIQSNLTGANYQWQVDAGSGFVNITNGANYNNSNTAVLQVTGAVSAWTGYKYRCIVDGVNSYVSVITFGNNWTGTVDSDWNNPGNWSCGTLPDANTDVVINSGNVIINSNITVRSLKILQGATVTVNTGYTLTVLH